MMGEGEIEPLSTYEKLKKMANEEEVKKWIFSKNLNIKGM